MLFFTCQNNECGFVIRVYGPDETETEHLIGPKCDWYPGNYPCPKCGEGMEHNVTCIPRTPVTDLSPLEAFVAFSGGGLPTEQECSATAVASLLESQPIKQAITRHIPGTNRCLLDTLILADGTKLYLGASTQGACVYRIAKSPNYAELAHE